MAKDLTNYLFEVHTTLKAKLKEAQKQEKTNLEMYRKEQLQFFVGDTVWLFCITIKAIHFRD